MRIDLAQARSALNAAAGRTADLLDSVPGGGLPVKGSEWTVGDVGAHLVVVLQGFTLAVEGSFDAVSPYISDTGAFPDRLAAVTAGTLELVPERHPAALATLVADAAHTFLAVTARRSPGEPVRTPWYGPQVSQRRGHDRHPAMADQQRRRGADPASGHDDVAFDRESRDGPGAHGQL